MRTVRLDIQYDGSAFYGMQRQSSRITVQQTVERGLKQILGQDVVTHYAGRTDAGVHAKQQVLTFCDKGQVPIPRLAMVLNKVLPESVFIVKASEVSALFSPRKSAVSREYIYWLYTGERSVFLDRYMVHMDEPIDIEVWKKLTAELIGVHDFGWFSKPSPAQGQTVRDLQRFDITKHAYEYLGYKGTCYQVHLKANGFLHHMVRKLIGFILARLSAELSEPQFFDVIKRKTKYNWKMVPARALFLERVSYEEEMESHAK